MIFAQALLFLFLQVDIVESQVRLPDILVTAPRIDWTDRGTNNGNTGGNYYSNSNCVSGSGNNPPRVGEQSHAFYVNHKKLEEQVYASGIRSEAYIHAQQHSTNVFYTTKDLETQIARRNSLRESIKGTEYSVQKTHVIDAATVSMRTTREYALLGDAESASITSKITDTFLDLATSFTPGVSWGRDLYEAIEGRDLISGETLDTFSRSLAVAGAVTAGFGSKIGKAIGVLNKISKGDSAFEAGLFADKLLKSASPASEIRNSIGTVTASSKLFDASKMMRGTHDNAGLIPKEIGENLVNKVFKDFSSFRKEFWKTVSESKYLYEFSDDNQRLLKTGLAPLAHKSQWVGKKTAYELHHIQPINRGGDVYDVSNIMIVSPRFHQEVLEKGYHYGK